jgi:ComF family protein
MTIESIIATVAPHYCVVCGQAKNLLCEGCMVELLESQKPVCHYCKSATDGTLYCRICVAQKPFENAWYTSAYDDVMKYLIQRYKFDHARSGAKSLASLLHHTLPQLPPDIQVTYVPTASGRIRERGFDHAKLLARKLADIRGFEAVDTLERTGNDRQVGASREKRLEQAEKLFAARDVQPLTYLLIDDVVTTGATIDTAAGLLMKAGAQAVYVGVVAH